MEVEKFINIFILLIKGFVNKKNDIYDLNYLLCKKFY